MRVSVCSVGLIGPGLDSWVDSLAILRGEQGHVPAEPRLPAPEGLPSAERRRIGQSVKIALAVAAQAFAGAAISPRQAQTVFSSSGGDGLNCHLLCEALADPLPQVSPTRFANSVHNAPAGYWGIATGSMKPSASLSAFDGSFAAGLLEAAINSLADGEPVALVAYDTPYPSPLSEKRPIAGTLGIALLLDASASMPSLATLHIGGYEHGPRPTGLADPGLEALRRGIPAARGLPLLAAIARGTPAEVIIEATEGQVIRVQVS